MVIRQANNENMVTIFFICVKVVEVVEMALMPRCGDMGISFWISLLRTFCHDVAKDFYWISLLRTFCQDVAKDSIG